MQEGWLDPFHYKKTEPLCFKTIAPKIKIAKILALIVY